MAWAVIFFEKNSILCVLDHQFGPMVLSVLWAVCVTSFRDCHVSPVCPAIFLLSFDGTDLCKLCSGSLKEGSSLDFPSQKKKSGGLGGSVLPLALFSGSATHCMGVYKNGLGSAFTTSMKLYHIGRSAWCPAEARGAACWASCLKFSLWKLATI